MYFAPRTIPIDIIWTLEESTNFLYISTCKFVEFHLCSQRMISTVCIWWYMVVDGLKWYQSYLFPWNEALNSANNHIIQYFDWKLIKIQFPDLIFNIVDFSRSTSVDLEIFFNKKLDIRRIFSISIMYPYLL